MRGQRKAESKAEGRHPPKSAALLLAWCRRCWKPGVWAPAGAPPRATGSREGGEAHGKQGSQPGGGSSCPALGAQGVATQHPQGGAPVQELQLTVAGVPRARVRPADGHSRCQARPRLSRLKRGETDGEGEGHRDRDGSAPEAFSSHPKSLWGPSLRASTPPGR